MPARKNAPARTKTSAHGSDGRRRRKEGVRVSARPPTHLPTPTVPPPSPRPSPTTATNETNRQTVHGISRLTDPAPGEGGQLRRRPAHERRRHRRAGGALVALEARYSSCHSPCTIFSRARDAGALGDPFERVPNSRGAHMDWGARTCHIPRLCAGWGHNANVCGRGARGSARTGWLLQPRPPPALAAPPAPGRLRTERRPWSLFTAVSRWRRGT